MKECNLLLTLAQKVYGHVNQIPAKHHHIWSQKTLDYTKITQNQI